MHQSTHQAATVVFGTLPVLVAKTHHLSCPRATTSGRLLINGTKDPAHLVYACGFILSVDLDEFIGDLYLINKD